MVDRLRHFRRALRVVHADAVPADQSFAPRAALVEIIVAKVKPRRVRAFLGALVDADDIELPSAVPFARPDRRSQRHAFADLPLEAVDERAPDNRAGARLEPRLLLLARKQVLRVHLQERLRLDWKAGEQVFWLLINAIEPGEVGSQGHARNL